MFKFNEIGKMRPLLAGVAGLVCALVIGKRKGFGTENSVS